MIKLENNIKIKIIIDEYGNRLKTLKPSTPARIVGWKSEPLSGDIFEKIPSSVRSFV